VRQIKLRKSRDVCQTVTEDKQLTIERRALTRVNKATQIVVLELKNLQYGDFLSVITFSC
jgi:hypothetical protein